MITANMHCIKTVKADEAYGTAWLKMTAEDGSEFAIFMPYVTAQAMADAYAEPEAAS